MTAKLGEDAQCDLTHMAMNSATDSVKCDDPESKAVISEGSLASSLPIGGPEFSHELNATSRVYSQPMLRQNLQRIMRCMDVTAGAARTRRGPSRALA